ncbi:MAG: ribose-phosphate diphosphokinase [Lactobacillaceae bacterium]|nr:ribose-phosphate diphosphokinase [Lactobacillaceae bacterium]
METGIKLIGLSTNPALSQKIADELHLPLTPITITRFADGEIYERIMDSIRGCDVFVISPIGGEVNDSFMEIMIAVDALRRASAKTINVVLPYYGYARQDRKAKSREPISAKIIASLLEMNGVARVLAVDLHADQLQGFFDIPVDHLYGAPLLTSYFYNRNILDNVVVVSPDHTGAGRSRTFAEVLKAPWGVVNDRVASENPANPDAIVGDVKGKNVIIVDDIIDSARRMITTAAAVKAAGALDVYAVGTHAVFSNKAEERLAADDNIKSVIVTDTLSVPADKQFSKLLTLSVAPLLAEAIKRIHNNQDIGPLLKSKNNPDVKL